MTDPTPGHTADSDEANSDVARSELSVPWLPVGGITSGLPKPLGDLPTFAVHDDNRPADSADRRLWVGTYEDDEPMPRVDLRQTDLHYGEGVSSDATRTDREIGIPVCDDLGRELGEMRMGYANGRVLMVMLADLVTDAYEPSSEWLERKPFDQLDDDQVDDLYDRLEVAQQTIAAYALREQPETWERQATEIAKQAMEIGDRDTKLAAVRELHRREPLYVVDCDCPRPDEADTHDTEAYDDYDDNHVANVDGDTACLKQPVGAECGHCHDSYGDTIPWPCPTIAALDQPTQEQTHGT